MREISEQLVEQIIGRIYRDTVVSKSPDYFVKHTYSYNDFKELTSKEVFHSIIGFLPNVTYRDAPFILSVTFDKRSHNYEITVKNPIM